MREGGKMSLACAAAGFLIRSNSMSTAAMAICWKGWFTVVRSIWGRAEKEMLSKPISENMKDYPENYVSVDNHRGMQIATEYLYSLGHRSILYFGARSDSKTHQLRLDGYLSTCEKLSIEPHVLRSSYTRSSREVGYAMGGEYFSRPHQETAILCAADMLAIGVMQAAFEAGIRIPKDISLMGFDNISFSALPQIDLTTVNQPFQQMAIASVDMLLDRIKNPRLKHAKLILPPSLIVRKSCRALGK